MLHIFPIKDTTFFHTCYFKSRLIHDSLRPPSYDGNENNPTLSGVDEPHTHKSTYANIHDLKQHQNYMEDERSYLKISKASLSKSSWKSIHYVTKCIQKIIIDIFMPLFSNANRVIEAVLEEMLMNHSSSSFAALFQGHFCHIVTRTQNERTVRLLEATLLPTSIFLFRNSDLWVF